MGSDVVRESDIKYIRAILLNPDPIVTATELSESVDVTQQATHKKLVDLEDRGLVSSKKVGANARVWWLTPTGKEAYSDSESKSTS